ncbi:2-oxoglutarate dehydrogenase complex dihydrolipoyllysine-residue succinyltransferase [Methylomonas sp. EFPC3]|uniref:2-oxoglutarate dehydrogenase complex dihydrolipoyllysine-residue succinyltransferase n=1 Tax=Methylomonas sp. EFPC3 TaxID=3021710 RepID=UPI0024173CA8|nr:2-oxoglutarate dehydrogenase complex dihydrolipoyllysine-residue succinyltransferase [Methylomonas sp. EFPC3]WFP51006.1 2-oxoglutarate dehydrogenase complex dihydrolipoyllysine-residue succinyltransferase [Methylomonas sp. EFPC3]
MSFDILVPSLPESVSDATLVAWHKQAGEWVNEGENLADLETDKVILEVPAPKSGTLEAIVVQDGETVVGGQLLAKLDVQSAKTAAPAAKPEEAPLSPSVRKLVAEKELDPSSIHGSGKHGRILKSDVLDYLQDQQVQPEPAPAVVASAADSSHSPISATAIAALRPEQRVPMTRLRAKVAERLLQAQQNAAMLTTFNEVNLKAVIELRNQYKDRFEAKHNIKLGFMSFFVKASIEALKRFPAINASIDGNDIIYHGYYDIGIAVTTQRGLIVPILRDADQLDFAGIEKGIHDFSNKARNGSISVEDLSGGTFTITNGGIFGSMLSTPILNPPQCAILGMHAIKDRPVVENGEIVIRPIMYLALSYDHRLVDGKEAVQFLGIIKECLEAPAHLLLNI